MLSNRREADLQLRQIKGTFFFDDGIKFLEAIKSCLLRFTNYYFELHLSDKKTQSFQNN